MPLESQEDVERICRELEGETFAIEEVRNSTRTKKAPQPFTTSTLQQEAAKTLNFSTSRTMRIAQQLYEGVDIEGEGTVGLITYLRTDSTRVAAEADAAAKAYIAENYGEASLGNPVGGAVSGGQDAHEAIRPTDIRRTPALIKESLSREQLRLYQLIWRRFTASRMANAVYDTSSARIRAGQYIFTAAASRLAFAGFLDVYQEEGDEKTTGSSFLSKLSKESRLSLAELKKERHFTQPPAHYTEASLVHAMEELGIGRPSTYAPTISTILARHYITKEQKNLYITELGEVVNDIMCREFPQIVDDHFTANMETLLDGVADGNVDWKTIVCNFYPDLEEAVQKAERELEQVEIAEEESDVTCENCGRKMVIKYGPHGKFLACPGFPDCRNTKPYYERIGVKCPLCGGELVVRRTRKGRRYYGCENSPACDFISWGRPVEERCPKCGSYMIRRGSHIVCTGENCGYKE